MATQFFVQKLVQTNREENIKAQSIAPVWVTSTDDWINLTKEQ